MLTLSKKRPSKMMVSTRSERKRGDWTTDDNEDDMDDVEQGNNSPELSITKFRKSIYDSDDDRGCTPEFSCAKVKKDGLVPCTQPKLGERAEPHPIFPPMINR